MRTIRFASAFSLLHCLHAAEITWDNGAGTPSSPNVSFHAADNWDTDTVPGAGDTVRILTHGGVDPVRLSVGAVEISSIVCKVPFSLGDSLQVSNPSEFENSLVTGGFGFLKANGEISLKGENHPRLVTLEGLAGFINFGNFSIDSRPVNTFFTNLDGATFTLASGQTTLFNFDNFGLLDLGATGGISSASHIENEGVVSKSNPASPSVISGTYIQDGGRTEVTNLGMLSITGATIVLNGGTLKSDGIFFLGSAGGATPNNVYDGATAIDGSGQVFQKGKFLLKKDLNLNLPGGVGYQIENDLTFKEGATLTNSKTMTIVSTPDFVPVTGQPPGTFRNAAGALVVQANSNPSLLIPVENVGTWEAGSFVPLNFRNTGTLRFRDAGNRITNPNGTTGTLTNATGGRVEHSQGDDPTTDTKISTDYNQEGGATTHIETGILTLDGGSAGLNGLFEIPVTGQLVIEKGNYLTKGGDLRFTGTGKARIGGSQLAPVLDFTTPGSSRSGIVTSKLGLTENGTILDPAIGFSFENGTVILDFEFENQGMFIWKGGKFVSALDAAGNAQTGFFQNMNRLDIVPTRAKTFDGMLTNSISGEIVGLIRQSDSVRFLRPDEFGATEEGGRIKNFGTHLLLANGHLSGGNGLTSVPDFDDDAEDASYYLPPGGELIADSGGTNNVDCSLANFGLIESRGTSVLAISKCLNLMNEGGLWVLRRGQWYSHPAARILFQEDIDIMATDWTALPGKITGLTSPEGVLTKTTTETHTNPITVTDGAELKTTEDCLVTMPACTFGSGGSVSGEGTFYLEPVPKSGDFSAGGCRFFSLA